MEGVRLEDVRRAWSAQDPALAKLMVSLVSGEDRTTEEPLEEGALTYDAFQQELRNWRFAQKSDEERHHYRVTSLRELEDKGRLPERLLLHELVLTLWETPGVYAREQLLELVATCPIKWGPWRGIKRIFKEAEERSDLEMLGAITARIDATRAASAYTWEVSGGTRTYMVRRAWRALRRIGEAAPSRYADAAVEFLRFYPEGTDWRRTWVVNHVLYHNTNKYNQLKFTFWSLPKSPLPHRAFPKAWQRSPRPLFTLLERAQAEHLRVYAIEALKTDFRTVLREVEPSWVARLTQTDSPSAHEFVIWLVTNVPKFEQAAFRQMGLHEGVLRLLDSPSSSARGWAAQYARTHARDLDVARLLLLANNTHEAVRKLATDLLRDKNPRDEVGLDAWGSLLGTPYAHTFAQDMIKKHFNSRDLKPDWFTQRLLSEFDSVREFARSHVLRVHTHAALGAAYFTVLFDDERLHYDTADWALEQLIKHFAVDDVGAAFWRRALLHPLAMNTLMTWIQEEKIKARSFGVELWKTLAFHPDFQRDAWIAELRASGPSWARELTFNESLAAFARKLLGDVRQFGPDEVGFDWLMQLVRRLESHYHNFAESYMLKALIPADFAPANEEEEAAAAGGAAAAGAATIDLNKATFLFTGKLSTMTRDEAEGKVTGANGKNVGSVTKTLDYLVVGDDGSPLFGNGKKGSKMVKAEKLQGEGSAVKIISETAFLQMLSGGIREIDSNQTEAGCLELWRMAISAEQADEPLRQFALTYLKQHHELLGPSLTDRQVDPGAEVPRSFFTWERVSPLLRESRGVLRRFARDLALWELAAWKPPIHELVELCELSHNEVSELFERALLAPEVKETQHYRLGRDALTPEGVYRFCESLDRDARRIGMALIARYADLAIAHELFRLTESPDRQMRAFVIRTIWSLYRTRGITADWKPVELEVRYPALKNAKKSAQQRESGAGPAARPAQWPASYEALDDFLRRVLYGIPPAKLGRDERGGGEEEASGAEAPTTTTGSDAGGKRRARPISARHAKRELVEVIRDLAVEQQEFAACVVPLLTELMGSRGVAERSACLVALTRIHAAHPALSALPPGVTLQIA